jgi:hypothetical protein
MRSNQAELPQLLESSKGFPLLNEPLSQDARRGQVLSDDSTKYTFASSIPIDQAKQEWSSLPLVDDRSRAWKRVSTAGSIAASPVLLSSSSPVFNAAQ